MDLSQEIPPPQDPSFSSYPEPRSYSPSQNLSPDCVGGGEISADPNKLLTSGEFHRDQTEDVPHPRLLAQDDVGQADIGEILPVEREGANSSQFCNTPRERLNRPMGVKANSGVKYLQKNVPRGRKRTNRIDSADSLPYIRTIPAENAFPTESNNSQAPSIHSTDTSVEDALIPPETSLEPNDVITKTYKRRFWILFIFCVLTWFSCVQWNAWGPISESMFAVFPDWTTSTVAMMENWVTLVFIFAVLPVCWLTGRIGLRCGIVISSLLLAIGLALRCITDKSPLFTIMCHICSILLGISITLILSAPPMVASVWFPHNERTSAISVIMAVSQLGCVGSYLEPLVVRAPTNNLPVHLIKNDIMRLLYSMAGFGGFLFLLILAYFPSRPPLPPSFSSSTERLNFKDGIQSIYRNRNFMLIVFLYGFATGPSLGWIGVLNFSLKPLGFNQDAAMFVGLAAVVSCFIVTMATGWLTDRLYGHLRQTIIILLLLASLSYYWFLLLSKGILPYAKWQVYLSVSLGLSLNFATIPLFFELAVEIAYPVPEVLVGGVITASDSFSTSIFLSVYLFKSLGFEWVSYTLVFSNAIPIIALMFIRTEYTRANLDSPTTSQE